MRRLACFTWSSVAPALLLLACAGVNEGGKTGKTGTGGKGGASGGAGGAGGIAVQTGSGGTGTGRGGSGGGSSTGTGGDRNCGLQTFDLVRKPSEVMLVLDRSASMKDPPDGASASTSKWDLVVPAINQVITETDSAIPWGMKSFPEGTGSECSAGSVTNRIDVQLAANNGRAVTAAVTATSPDGNGTPTGDAINQAVAYLKMLNDDNRKYILLATDGDPSCPTPSTTARSFAVQAITDAAAAGFHTFVVGVSTTKASSIMTLNAMASAGLEARNDPNPLALRFYLANNRDELVNALKVITGQIASCSFPLKDPPPVPENIAVKVSGTKAPRDPGHTDGWDYADGAYSAVNVYGSWCEMIKTSAANMVQITYGCPQIPIP